MRGAFRRDLTLAPGPGFRLQRRRGARVLSALLAVAAIGWGAFDLVSGLRFVGGATLLLAAAFVVQLVQAEMSSWRFDGLSLRSRRLRVDAEQIKGVHLAFDGGRARAWVEIREGEPVALVEGDEADVRRIADRLTGALALARTPPPPRQMVH
ncbi:MAG TPA: hypothetical protein VLW85_09170 [Myxococcales bacterium]|nr:hypothetical protein [Myxococcales bacterium]